MCTFLPNYWPWSLWKVLFTWFYIYIWQAFRLSGTTFDRKVCMKFEYVCNYCKPIFCEHNLPVEATCTFMWPNLEERDPWLALQNPHFFVTTWPNEMGSSLNCRKIAIVHSLVWFFRYHKGFFHNRYPIADCNFFGDNLYCVEFVGVIVLWVVLVCRVFLIDPGNFISLSEKKIQPPIVWLNIKNDLWC